MDYLYRYYEKRGTGGFFTSNNLAFPCEQLKRLGGFDVSFPLAAGEDRELCQRWARAGLPLRFVAAARVYHEHALTPGSFVRQHFNYGRGAFQFHRLRSRQSDGKIRVEPLSFYRDLLLYPLTQSPTLRGLGGSGLLLLSQVSNVAGYFWERARQKRSAE
ncbi:MAG: hypothetical protein H7039_07810 [Bryobacteraceae bacterium]|nr:hypothetical protein [Bryobacteraceae bacterium]